MEDVNLILSLANEEINKLGKDKLNILYKSATALSIAQLYKELKDQRGIDVLILGCLMISDKAEMEPLLETTLLVVGMEVGYFGNKKI